MKKSLNTNVSTDRIIVVGLLIGFLLNITGWLGNNFLLKSLWIEVGNTLPNVEWRNNTWRHIFSLIPDFVYGLAIAWLCRFLNTSSSSTFSISLKSGIFVSLVGGITTYFAIANSGFIPWKLAILSFGLVLITKLPLAILTGIMLNAKK